jgi:hypothetical protein
MATIKTARVMSDWTILELMDDAPATGVNTIASKAFNASVLTLSPTSDPPVEKYAAWKPAIPSTSSGVLTLPIDLTDLPGTEEDVDGTGLKVRRLRLQNPATNEGPVTIGPAAADGYHLFGADNEIEVPIGGSIDVSFGDDAPVIGSWSGANNQYLELAGEDGDEYKLEILLG